MELEAEPNEKRTKSNPQFDRMVDRFIASQDLMITYCNLPVSLISVTGSIVENARVATYFAASMVINARSKKTLDILGGLFYTATAPVYIPLAAIVGAISPFLTKR